MSMIQDVSAEQLAKLFHYYQEGLEHDTGDHGREEESWQRISPDERKVMVAAARLTLLELAVPPAQPSPSRKYYATPGEAEWGC
jgi:hypothetical protein